MDSIKHYGDVQDHEPPIPEHHLEGPSVDIQAVFESDKIPPAKTLRERSDYIPENKTIPLSRYITREYHDLEAARLWGRVWQYAPWTLDMPNRGDLPVYIHVGRTCHERNRAAQ